MTVDRAPATDLDTLLPRIAARDEEAFVDWMRSAEHRIRDSLRSFAARVDVEATVQETLLRVWQMECPPARWAGYLLAMRRSSFR